MGAKNNFLNELAIQRIHGELEATIYAMGQTKQAMIDAIIVTAGYGSCMKNDKWGEQRIQPFIDEVLENYRKQVFPGIEVRPDAPGFRDSTDALIQKKCPKYFAEKGAWPQRYHPYWEEPNMEEEKKQERRCKNIRNTLPVVSNRKHRKKKKT